MKKILICLLSILLLLSLTACSNGSAESVNSAGELTRKLKSKSDKVIEVSGDIVLTKTIEIVGNKEIVGNGSITVSVADMQDGYVIGLSEGAHLTVGGSVRLDLAGLAGGIHVKEGTELTLQDEAVVTGASVKASNVLVEGAFTMNGGFLKMAKGHNLINKGDATIAGGELKGCGSKYAVIYNDGTLTQNDGTIVGGYHNVVGVSGSSFVWNKGEIKTSLQDAIVIEEDASIDITSADAKLTEVYAKGLVVNGEGVIDGVTMKNSMDSMIAVGKNGELTLNGGKITEAGIHGIDNAGTLLMTDGVVYANGHSGICNTGSLEITGGDLMNNKSKGVLNKAGIAKILDEKVTITGNKEGVANEIGAYIELSAASIIQNKDSNIYAYGGDMYIHDIALSSSGAGCINVNAADVILENVNIQGTTGGNGAHGIYMTGGSVVAQNTSINEVNGCAVRVVGEDAVFNGKNLTFEKSAYSGISVTTGTVVINGLTTSNLGAYNVLATGGVVNLSNATLGKTPENSVRTKNDAVLDLKNVEILGHTEKVNGNVYGIIIDDGNVTAKNLTIKDTYKAGIRIKGGKLSAEKVKISNAGEHGINAASGVAEITYLTTSNVSGCNVYMKDDAKLSVTDAEFGKCTDNSIKEYGNEDAVLNLTNVTVLGHTEDALESVHGLIVDNGTVTAKNLKISDVVSAGLRVRGGSLTAEDVIISDTGEHGINVNGGITKITNLTTSSVSSCNVYMKDDAKLSVTDAKLGKCRDNSIKEYGNEDAVLNLTNVTVLGHTEDALDSVHGLIVDNGTVTAKNLKISDVVASGLRVKGGRLTAEVMTISNAESNGVYITAGTLTAEDVTISDAGEHGINAKGGTAAITKLTTSNVSSCNVYMEGDAKLSVTDAKLGKCRDNSIKEYGNKDAVLNLTNVTVLGHTEDALDSVHGLIVDNGTVTAKNLKISDVVASGLRVRGGSLTAEVMTISNAESNGVYITAGTLTAEDVTISDAGEHGINAKGGTAAITKLTTSNVSSCNVYMEGDAKLSVTDAELGKCCDNSIKEYGNEDAVLELTNVTVLGHTEDALTGVHGLIVDNGTVTAKNLKISDVVASGLRVRGGSLTAEDVTVSNVGTHGVHMTAGIADITELTISTVENNGVHMTGGTAAITKLTASNVSSCNVYMEGDAKLSVTDAELGKCRDNSIKEYGNEDAVLNLTNVTVLGHTEDALNSVHGLIVDNGTVTAKNLKISDVVASGLRVKGGRLTAEDVKVSNVGTHGVHMTAGTADITELTISTEHNGVYITEGTLTLNGADITSTAYDVYNKTSNLKLAGIINAQVYNDASVTINADSLYGSKMTIDWPLDKLPANMVGIQFSSEENATASKGCIEFGDSLKNYSTIKYVPDFYGDQMLIMDKNSRSYTVNNYNDLYAVLNNVQQDDDVTTATITLNGDIIVPSTITIAEGKNIILVDNGNLINIMRDQSAFDVNKDGVLFKVENNASLTFRSTGTDESPRLIVNGSQDSYQNISMDWAMVETLGEGSKVNVNAGVEFINNYSGSTGSAINMTAGTLTINGGTFSSNTSLKEGGALYIGANVTATIKNVIFTQNNSNKHGGAIYNVDGSTVTIEGCTFNSNTTTGNGGAIANNNKQAVDNASIKNCTFNNNTANNGGAINMASKSYITLEDCTFTTNTATNIGKDINLAGNIKTQVHISGKIVAEIFNGGQNVLYVDEALEDGSDVKIKWLGEVTLDDGITFASFVSDDVMNASKPYISLGETTVSETYSLAYINKTGKLVEPIKVAKFDDLTGALTTIAATEEKLCVIRLSGDISVPSTIQIPENCNVTIEDDGTARTLSKNAKDFDMIELQTGSTLTLRSTGTVDDCKLILDGQNLTATKNAAATIIRLKSDVSAVVCIYNGVKLQNNNSGKGGAGVCVETTSGAVYVNGAFFENISATGDGGVFYLKSPCTIMNSKFKNNTSTKSGGAIIVKKESTTSIINTHFENCNANIGGAIRSQGILQLVGTLPNATFLNNTATGDGSALYIDGTLTGSGYTFTPEYSKSVFVDSGATNNYSNEE